MLTIMKQVDLLQKLSYAKIKIKIEKPTVK